MRCRSTAPDRCVAVSGEMDRRAVEALQLEVRRLAERYGIRITAVRIDRSDESGSA